MSEVSLWDRKSAFFVVWGGQLVSLVGSGLTAFAVSVWIYQVTGSITKLALVSFIGTTPSLVLLPFLGAMVDRWDLRRAMIFSELGAGFCTLCLAVLFFTGRHQLWQLYLLVALLRIFAAIQLPAYTAATTMLVPREHLGRANGLIEMAEAAVPIISPTLAGVLIGYIKVQGVALIDFATYLFAVLTLLMIRIPARLPAEQPASHKTSLLSETWNGFRYIKDRRGLLTLLLLFSAINFSLAFTVVLLTPLVLGFGSPAVLGTVLSMGGIGWLVGGTVMGVWGGPKHRVAGILGFGALTGLFIALTGLRSSATLISASIFAFHFCYTVVIVTDKALWQTKVAPVLQGRIFALKGLINHVMAPLAFVIAGPLTDKVFRHLLVQGGPLSGKLGWIFGTGESRGIGLLITLLGLLVIVSVAVASQSRHLKFIEEELPDTVPAGQAVRIFAHGHGHGHG
jgi:DHA3 family macrolide efflux protein-like MFS transporter